MSKLPANLSDLDQYECQRRTGTTTEELPCEVNLYYPIGAPIGAEPAFCIGFYSSGDGGGSFDLAAPIRVDDMPHVVAGGDW